MWYMHWTWGLAIIAIILFSRPSPASSKIRTWEYRELKLLEHGNLICLNTVILYNLIVT
jgi:hypothetical protein